MGVSDLFVDVRVTVEVEGRKRGLVFSVPVWDAAGGAEEIAERTREAVALELHKNESVSEVYKVRKRGASAGGL